MAMPKILLSLPVIVALFGGSLSTAQAQTPNAAVSSSLNGTYDLVLDFASTGIANFPFKKGDKVRFVIDSAAGTLCVNGSLITSRPTLNAASSAYTWAPSNTNTIYEIALSNGAFHEVNAYQGSTSNFAGQFVGTRTSTSTACVAATTTTTTTTSTTPTITVDMQSVFDLAAEIFPSIFKDGSALGTFEGYVYKYFASSKVYVGFKDNALYLMGGQFGNTPSNKGPVSAILKELQTAKAEIAKAQAAANTSTGGSTAGLTLYTLRVTGSIATSGIAAITLPALDFTLPNMPAPSVNDTSVIINQVQSQLAGVSGIGNIQVTSINNTASRVTFRVAFSATMSGLSVTYDLTYDYTR